jgi:hypothetical protein
MVPNHQPVYVKLIMWGNSMPQLTPWIQWLIIIFPLPFGWPSDPPHGTYRRRGSAYVVLRDVFESWFDLRTFP